MHRTGIFVSALTTLAFLGGFTGRVHGHAAHGAHGAAAAAASTVNDDKHCPLCNMFATDYNLTWFTELNNGQRIYTCGMTDGTQYKNGKNSFSHSSLVGATLGSLVVEDGTGCNNTCPECNDPTTSPVLDPISGSKISSTNFTYLCLKRGQKIYFESNATKSTFLSGSNSKSYFSVKALTCNNATCPDSFQEVPQDDTSTTTPTPTTSLRGNDGVSSDEPFCSGSSAMFSGFQSTVHGTCVKLLFQPWVLNSQTKYAFGMIGVFLLPLMNEFLVFSRERLRQKFRVSSRGGAKYKNKLILTTLYMAQMTLAYFAMLVVMIYDTGLFIALIGGFGFGYAWFKSYKEAKVTKQPAVSTPATSASVAAPWRFQQLESLTVLHVSAMQCMANCGSTVQAALESVTGVERVFVDMNEKIVYVDAHDVTTTAIVDAVESVGFDAVVLREAPSSKNV
ncbi:unnamed protein product [Aphanomyces euteiches]|uniref:Copper transport protein n=1 Tax=Aphanomyces euteiches TaxID=100861 RepID=A0A6G0X8Y7_9STRA|nr:hypothetical protein Ae201684_007483 [Aphanomyces euteiches]KAH9100860.1 hypothetical protein Ae201684P_007052 [Aphanomyces euteiches]KAH9143680.1 hypothetical protein AeRB84_012333 [Aphanomyces euteiches]